MSSLILRTCNSDKSCSKCDKPINKGEDYWSGPYKALCIPCHEEDKRESTDIKKTGDDTYIVTGTCVYCKLDAVGVLWGKKICAAHINQILTESI